MALDTKYRPLNYDDVIGQEASVEVLRQFVKEGRGFRQSYVFCGQHGSGKTTLGRILAKALLCLSPKNGEACNDCHSCQVFLSGGVHEGFEERDAASKSGKNDLDGIIQDIGYHTFGNTRRIYLFDESHRLSKQALDVLLKPMEDNVEGTEDKKLICIFCTTDPGKMATTIFSRCAPAFVIRACTPEQIADRLEYVCKSEGLEYEYSALVTIAEVSELHIRDALMKVDGISMLGSVNDENVTRFLQLGVNVLALDLIEAIGTDLQRAVALASQMSIEVSPASAYERLAAGALCAYRAGLGVGKIPAHWKAEKIVELARRGPELLGIAGRFAAPPHRANRNTLVLDVGTLHHSLTNGVSPSNATKLVFEVQNTPSGVQNAPPTASVETEVSDTGKVAPVVATSEQTSGTVAKHANKEAQVQDGVWIDPRGIGQGLAAPERREEPQPPPAQRTAAPGALPPFVFRELVLHHLQELSRGGTTSS